MADPSASLSRQATAGVKWNGVATVSKIGVQFATMAVLARLLAPGDFGLMSMAVVVTGFAQAFADLGLSGAIIQRQNTTTEQLSSLYWLNLAFGVLLFAAIWLVTPLAVAYYKNPALAPILRWSAASMLITPVGQQFQSLLQKELRFKTVSLIKVSEGITYALAAIALAFHGFGAMSLVWATLVRAATSASLFVVVGARSDWLPSLHFRRSDLRGLLGFGMFQMGERSLNYLAANVDYLIIGRFLGAEPLGYYTVAYNLMRMPLNYINPVVVSVAFPTFARIQDRDDLLRRGYGKIIHYLSAVTFPVMAGLFVTAPLCVPLLYGKHWEPSVPIVQIFCLLGANKSLGNPLGSILLAKGRADLGFYMNLFSIVGSTIANLVGVRWGIAGVAASTLVFSLLLLRPVDIYLRWITIKMTTAEFWQSMLRPLFATIPMFALTFAMRYLLAPFGHKGAQLVVIALVGALVYGGLLWVLDRPLVEDFRSRLGSRRKA